LLVHRTFVRLSRARLHFQPAVSHTLALPPPQHHFHTRTIEYILCAIMSPSSADLNALMVAVSKHIPNIDILPSVDYHLFTTNAYASNKDNNSSTMRLWVGRLRIADGTRVPLWAFVENGNVKFVHTGHSITYNYDKFELIPPFCTLNHKSGKQRHSPLEAAVLWYHVAGASWPALWDSKTGVKKSKAWAGLRDACDTVAKEIERTKEMDKTKSLFVTESESEDEYDHIPLEEYDMRGEHAPTMQDEVEVLSRTLRARVKSSWKLAALFRKIDNRKRVKYADQAEKREVKELMESMRG
jgi:hypothetical protein